MRTAVATIAAIGAMIAAACGDGTPAPTPRRHGYPRIQVYDSCYSAVPGAALRFEVNCMAEARVDSGGRWLTVGYPLYGADLYITFTRAESSASLSAALDNRRERMVLNLGGADAATTHISSVGGFEAALVEAPGSGMPLQFVATDGGRYVASGAVQLIDGAYAPYDSIRPVVAALRRDIVHALSQLSSDD